MGSSDKSGAIASANRKRIRWRAEQRGPGLVVFLFFIPVRLSIVGPHFVPSGGVAPLGRMQGITGIILLVLFVVQSTRVRMRE
jgi:hypothetical protein